MNVERSDFEVSDYEFASAQNESEFLIRIVTPSVANGERVAHKWPGGQSVKI